MSVSIKLSPASKFFRVLMGKNGFEQWINAMEDVKQTTFENEVDLVETLQASGLPLRQRGNVYQTSFGPLEYLLWEYRDGEWIAVFNESSEVLKMMRTIEKATGRQIFKTKESLSQNQQQSFPTNFKDMTLLQSVLNDNHVAYEVTGSRLSCQIDGKQLVFVQPAQDGMIVLEASINDQLSDIYSTVSSLDEDYQSKIQERTYQRFIEKVNERGFTIEQEEILADNSIVLSVNVGR